MTAILDVTGKAFDRKGDDSGDVWTAVDTHAHRQGTAAWLPIDVPKGTRVRVLVETDAAPPLTRERARELLIKRGLSASPLLAYIADLLVEVAAGRVR